MHATDTLHNNLDNILHNKNRGKTGVPEITGQFDAYQRAYQPTLLAKV